jgi:restriction system protein
MAHRRQTKQSLVDDLFDLLLEVPAWVGPILAAVVFAVMRWVMPPLFMLGSGDNDVSRGGLKLFAMVSHGWAPWAGGFILLVWIGAEIKKALRRLLLDRQTGAASIRTLDWGEFEELLAEAFRRQGFMVEHCGAAGPDGGIDIRLSKAGAVTLVQCKHWQARQVGVRLVRELLGVVASEGAQSGILVTSGSFTADAQGFAAKNPIRLVDGRELMAMIGQVQKAGRISPQVRATPSVALPAREAQATAASPSASPVEDLTTKCPQCASPMVRRLAKRGTNAGSTFLGCSRYPTCRGTLPLG